MLPRMFPSRLAILAAALTLACSDARADPLALRLTAPLASPAPAWLVPAELGGGFVAALVAQPVVRVISAAFDFAGLDMWAASLRFSFSIFLPAMAAAGTVLAIADLDPGWRPRWGTVLGLTGLTWVVVIVATAISTGSFLEGLFYGAILVATGQYFHPWQLAVAGALSLTATVAANTLTDPRRGGSMWQRPREPDADEDPFALARPPEPASHALPPTSPSFAWAGNF